MRYDRPGKRLLRTFFFDFLRLFETDLAQKLDASHLVLLDKELLGATPHEKRHEVDVLVRSRLRGEKAERARVKWACYDLTARLGLSEEHALTVLEFVEVHLPLNGQEQAEFEAHFRAANPGIQEVVMKFSNQWVEKGWREGKEIGIRKGEQIGIQKGEQRGRQAQALDLLVRLLTQRVGPVPEATREMLAGLPLETLVAMAEGIFTVQSFDDLQRWL